MNELPPFISMADLLEEDYNAKYEEWKRNFYRDNMTNHAPITIGGITYKKYEKRESNIIRFMVTALIVIGVIFWLIPEMYYKATGTPNANIGTLDALEDVFKPNQSGVYIMENGKIREANKDEIDYQMETRPCGAGGLCID